MTVQVPAPGGLLRSPEPGFFPCTLGILGTGHWESLPPWPWVPQALGHRFCRLRGTHIQGWAGFNT